MVNQAKLDVCRKARDKLLLFDKVGFKEYLESFMKEATYIQRIKGGIYCAVCDATQQSFIDGDGGRLFYSGEFCRNLIITSENYLKFVNIFMIQFGDAIAQFINCFKTDSVKYYYPIKSKLFKQMLMIRYFEDCFHNVNKPDFMKYCIMICRDFKINGDSTYFDGNLGMLYGIYLEVIELLQAYQIPYSHEQNVDEEFLKSINSPIYTPARKLNKLEDKTAFTGYSPVYDNVKKNLDLAEMENIFLNLNQGLNLISLYQRSNLDILKDEFVEKNFIEKEKASPIQTDVIKKYFQASEAVVQKFNQDFKVKTLLLPKSNKPIKFQVEKRTGPFPEKEPDLSNPLYQDKEFSYFFKSL